MCGLLVAKGCLKSCRCRLQMRGSGSQETAANGCREISSRYHHRWATSWCSGMKGGGCHIRRRGISPSDLKLQAYSLHILYLSLSIYFDVKNHLGTNAKKVQPRKDLFLLSFEDFHPDHIARRWSFSNGGWADRKGDDWFCLAYKMQKINIYIYNVYTCIQCVYIDRYLGIHIYIYTYTLYFDIFWLCNTCHDLHKGDQCLQCCLQHPQQWAKFLKRLYKN